jgi:hypothetical protein
MLAKEDTAGAESGVGDKYTFSTAEGKRNFQGDYSSFSTKAMLQAENRCLALTLYFSFIG